MRSRLSHFIAGPIILAVLVGCNTAIATPEPDRVATRVAEEIAIAATLTAIAPPQPPPASPPQPPSPPPATNTPAPTQPPLPTATPDLDAVIPGAGTPKGLLGTIRLPGYAGPLEEPIVFQDTVTFHLQVYDPDTGSQANGAGVNSVDIFITDPDGETVQQRTERNPKYCAFSGGDNGEPCSVWVLSEHGNAWPNGQAVVNDMCCYGVNMVVHTLDPNKDGANWRFTFIVRQP
jgi:hypothetical protein